MKKTTTFVLAVLLIAGLTTCASAATPKSGAAAAAALIKMLPKTATGVVGIDVRQLMTSEGVTKALQDPKTKGNLDDFIKMSGIDPTKDIFYAGIGLIGSPTGSAQGAAIITLKYDKAKLQALIKEKAPEAKEEVYQGVTIYSNIDGDGKQKTGAAFLDATHIVIGTEAGVKGIIDAAKKKAVTLAKDPAMSTLINKADKAAMVWGAIAVPQDLLQKATASNPQLKVLEGVTGLVLGFNEKLDGVVIDLKTIGGTKEQNTNLAQTLNGLRALGAMAGDKEPLIGQLLNGVAVTSGADYTEVAINIPREVLDKLGEFAKSKAGQYLMGPKKDAAPEVKK
jgi:hypothetical protein